MRTSTIWRTTRASLNCSIPNRHSLRDFPYRPITVQGAIHSRMKPSMDLAATPRPPSETVRPSFRVVAMGGGTGLSTLLRGLKRYVPSVSGAHAGTCENDPCVISDLAAIVTVTDDGGASGRLRKDFNMLPP